VSALLGAALEPTPITDAIDAALLVLGPKMRKADVEEMSRTREAQLTEMVAAALMFLCTTNTARPARQCRRNMDLNMYKKRGREDACNAC